jgi:hypothetical protein
MNKIKRPYLTNEQGLAMIEAFKKGDLKPMTFCKKNKVSYPVFRYWLTQVRKKSVVSTNEACFLPVKLNNNSSAYSPAAAALKVCLNAGITIEVPAGFDIFTFKQVIEVCQNVVNR